MSRVHITQTTSFLPGSPIPNDQMERYLGQVGDRPSRARATVLRSNGITSRHYAIDPETGATTHSNAEMAAQAIRQLLNADPSPVGLLSCGTSSPDALYPPHGDLVANELGANWTAGEILTTSGVCVSSMTAMKYAWMSVLSGDTDSAIVVGSESSSSFMRGRNFDGEYEARAAELDKRPSIAFEKDFLRWMLSDGAGALKLEREPPRDRMSLRVEWIDISSYANELEPCMYAGCEKNEDGSLRPAYEYTPEQLAANSVMAIKQDVRQLEPGVRRATRLSIRAVQDKRGLKAQDVRYLLPHYSSAFFRDYLYEYITLEGFDVPQERWFTNLSRVGNVGSASIFLMLDEFLRTQPVEAGDQILCYVPESARFSIAWMLLTAVAPAEPASVRN